MLLKIGFDITISCQQPTPVFLKLMVETERQPDLKSAEVISTSPHVVLVPDSDAFLNRVNRGVLAIGATRIYSSCLIDVSDAADPVDLDAVEVMVDRLPSEVLRYLKPSRYCESDLLGDFAWARFSAVPPGWSRVQAIMDYVHNHLVFSYPHASATRTAASAQTQGIGVCRDFAHLAIALCRAMNIPARYCNGYMGDIGVPYNPAPMDYNAWVEVYLSGRWWTFDARHNVPRIGRVVICRGMDAADCAMIHTFGRHELSWFEVTAEEAAQTLVRAA